MTSRRFPAPRRIEQIPGGYKVLDANGQALAYVYARETSNEVLELGAGYWIASKTCHAR